MTTNDHIMRLVIASDNRLFREGLLRLLQEQTDIEIVGEADNERQATAVVNNLKPDILLLCTTLAELISLQIITAVKQISPATKIIILSGAMDEAAIIEALRAGAKGYIPKDSGISSLVNAIKVVHSGELWIERKLIAKYFDGDISDDSKRDESGRQTNIKEVLTTREQDVLSILTFGATNREIAQKLSISEKTVKSHLNSIFKKLNVSRRIEAILFAIKQGFR